MPRSSSPKRDTEGVSSSRTAGPGASGEGSPRRADARRFSDFAEAMAFLTDRVNFERAALRKGDVGAFKPERMQALMDALDNPHRSFKSVHVAGSKGKGSVCEMTASCLQACGYTTGLYTSPHLVSPLERIRINQAMIPEEDFRAGMDRVAGVVPKVRKSWGDPTYFELMTALAFLYFAEQAVDMAVVEVGLGGRLDSTNVVLPEVCAITAIQLEHKSILGDTLEKIAGEKAGIIKPGVPVVTLPQSSESVLDVFRQAAAEKQAPLLVLGRDLDFSARVGGVRDGGGRCQVCLRTQTTSFEHLVVPLKGEHQALNCGLALAILDQLREKGHHIAEKDVAEGLARTPTHGRMELVRATPRVIVDGAHNPESVEALVRAIGAHLRYDSMIAVFGCAADKEIPGMLAKLALGADKVIFTRAADNPRAADPRELARKYAETGSRMYQTAPSVKEALELALRGASRDDVICVTGSFYLAGEAKGILAGGTPPPHRIQEVKPAHHQRRTR